MSKLKYYMNMTNKIQRANIYLSCFLHLVVDGLLFEEAAPKVWQGCTHSALMDSVLDVAGRLGGVALQSQTRFILLRVHTTRWQVRWNHLTWSVSPQLLSPCLLHFLKWINKLINNIISIFLINYMVLLISSFHFV